MKRGGSEEMGLGHPQPEGLVPENWLETFRKYFMEMHNGIRFL